MEALKARDLATFNAFTSAGRFGQWSSEFFTQIKKGNVTAARTAMAIWVRKDMLGIQAKLAANPKNGGLLGLTEETMSYGRERQAPEVERAVWLVILRLKYVQNHQHRRVLLSTERLSLYEFDRTAASATGSHWGACRRRKTDGALVGENAMGRYMMAVRELIAQ